MLNLKSGLTRLAKACRALAFGLDHWPWVLLIICIISPISPHVRLPYEASYSACAYVGTRGIIRADASECPLIALINTTNDTILWRGLS